jgi:hypothetical protein
MLALNDTGRAMTWSHVDRPQPAMPHVPVGEPARIEGLAGAVLLLDGEAVLLGNHGEHLGGVAVAAIMRFAGEVHLTAAAKILLDLCEPRHGRCPSGRPSSRGSWRLFAQQRFGHRIDDSAVLRDNPPNTCCARNLDFERSLSYNDEAGVEMH